MKSIYKNSDGFTLIEALVAVVVITIGILSLYTMQIASIKGNAKANRMTVAATLAGDRVEQSMPLEYANIVDTDNDGTNQDPDRDGVDNDGGNFGLNDAACCPDGNDPLGNPIAGGCVERADNCFVNGEYWIFMNVAEEVVMPNTKSIRVLVQRTTDQALPPIVVNYVKGLYY